MLGAESVLGASWSSMANLIAPVSSMQRTTGALEGKDLGLSHRNRLVKKPAPQFRSEH